MTLTRIRLLWTVLWYGDFLSLQSPRNPYSWDGPVTRLLIVRMSKRRLLEALFQEKHENDRLRAQLRRER